MTQEDKQLLLKDLCARLPYGVKAEVMGWDEEKEEEVFVPVTVYSVNTDGYVYFADNDYDITYRSIDVCRLYLRPMSSMTMEEQREYISAGISMSPDNPSALTDWLNANHFNYRLPPHLFIEAPADMYKTE